MSTAQPVRVSYQTLLENPASLHSQIRDAFGSDPGCLGIIVVDGLPSEFPQIREKLFRLAHAFAQLPETVREQFARPYTSYMFGWSHGKEVMNGRPDTMKGSYYANPLLDIPDVTESQRNQHPEYYTGNVWPDSVPGLEDFSKSFKELGTLVAIVGMALARACESFVPASGSGKSIETLIRSSKSNKARLLHYFAEPTSTDAANSDSTLANDALCGTHLDHSLLTGLCSAMYLTPPDSSTPQIVPAPSSTAGLWIYPRHGPDQPRPSAVKVQIPPDCLAFQTGEALALLTADKLAATPHFVSGTAGSTQTLGSNPTTRETFALFLQPDVDDVIGVDGETFGQFTKRVLGRHYAKATAEAED